MKSYLIKETREVYHKISIDELDIEGIVTQARKNKNIGDGIEAIKDELNYYNIKYGFDYAIKENFCGDSVNDLEVIGCEDDTPELCE